MRPCHSAVAPPRLRVIAGTFRSRPLRSLPGADIRPTSDRLRETLFNVLAAGRPQALHGALWLDLYAGTGAVGIEALSRGALKVLFVESSSAACSLIKANLSSLQIASGFELLQEDASRALRRLHELDSAPDFIFLDPPYRLSQAYADCLGIVAASPLLSRKSILIAEHARKFDPGDGPPPLRRYRRLDQGDASLSFYRASA